MPKYRLITRRLTTTATCIHCGNTFEKYGRMKFCSPACRISSVEAQKEVKKINEFAGLVAKLQEVNYPCEQGRV